MLYLSSHMFFLKSIRERSFNLKGGGGRGYGFFLKKYSDFGGEKKNLIQSFCHNLMLNSGEKKNVRFARQKK